MPDQSRWRYEEAAEPFRVAREFGRWLESEPQDLAAGEALTTAASWRNWNRLPLRERQQLCRWLTHWSSLVRYPADGMAYVTCPVTHPDHEEALSIPPGASYEGYWITLLDERGSWRVHSIGLGNPTPPAALGLKAYSW